MKFKKIIIKESRLFGHEKQEIKKRTRIAVIWRSLPLKTMESWKFKRWKTKSELFVLYPIKCQKSGSTNQIDEMRIVWLVFVVWYWCWEGHRVCSLIEIWFFVTFIIDYMHVIMNIMIDFLKNWVFCLIIEAACFILFILYDILCLILNIKSKETKLWLFYYYLIVLAYFCL